MGLFSNFFGGDKQAQAVNLQQLGTDVHSHLIPGIDDGAQDMETSLSLIKRFIELGYSKVITTPHVMGDYYKNDQKTILGGLETLQKELQKEHTSIEIEAAAEYYLDQHFFQLIMDRELLTFGDKYVLFELSFNAEPPQVKESIFEMITAGYKPILAHVERYAYYHNDWEQMDDLKRRGCLFQLNINSLSGHYGKPIRKMAEQLIERGYISLLGSDCHRMQHLDLLDQTRKNKHLKLAMEGDLLNYHL